MGEVFNIISQQSTAKPGCIIELDAITDFVCICSQSNLTGTKSKLQYYMLVVVLRHLYFLIMPQQQGKETQLLHVFEEDLILGNEKKDDYSQELPPAENSMIPF